ncbi:hypothetical protein MKW92_014252 [Papaver armeniacum]|nr:hypothetical protein MKW92_014252 [Papaver armeniacum]
MDYLRVPLLVSLKNYLNSLKANHNKIIDLPGEDEKYRVDLYYRPVIGILSHPGDGASGRLNKDKNASYIAASYVKFIESAGARVIPFIYNEPKEILYEKLNLVNGVLLTGGWKKSGFELLCKIISKDADILEKFSAHNHASTLQFSKPIDIQGTVFQRFSPELLQKLTTDCLVMQLHKWGVSPERFRQNSKLCSFFRVLTTCVDEDNKEYVSTKNAFEWGYSTIPHSEDAVQVTQHVANYFISEARKSLNRPRTRDVLDNLIYNYVPVKNVNLIF